jgi:hypothetical protein
MLSEAKSQFAGAIRGLVVSASLLAATTAHAEIFEGYPDAIICKGPNFRAIGYISQVRDDGSAVYMSLTQAFGIVTPDRVFHREGLKDCDGKTLEQLKQEGKTRGFKS